MGYIKSWRLNRGISWLSFKLPFVQIFLLYCQSLLFVRKKKSTGTCTILESYNWKEPANYRNIKKMVRNKNQLLDTSHSFLRAHLFVMDRFGKTQVDFPSNNILLYYTSSVYKTYSSIFWINWKEKQRLTHC